MNAANPGFSYDEWFKEGKALPRSVDILAGILEAENLEKPSADGMRIAYALGWIGDRRRQVVEALIRALQSRNVALRMEAISAPDDSASRASSPCSKNCWAIQPKTST